MLSAKHQTSINLDDLEESKSDIEYENPPTFKNNFNVTYKKETQAMKATENKLDPKSFEEDVVLMSQSEFSG